MRKTTGERPPLPGFGSEGAPTNQGLLTHEIRTADGLQALEGPWRDLFALSACPSVFSSWEWVSEWSAHFAPTLTRYGAQAGPLFLAVTDECRRLVGASAFLEVPGPCLPLGERRLIQIGTLFRDGTEAEEPVLLCRPGRQDETVRAMLAHLTRPQPRGRWNHYTLQCPAPGGTVSAHGQSDTGFPHWEQFHTIPGCLTVPLPSTWDVFRSRLGYSMRHNLSYYPRRLTRTGRPWVVQIHETPADVAQALPVLVALHKRRAESRRGTPHCDHLPTPTHTGFLTRCATRLAGQGQAFVAALTVDGVPIAAQLFFQSAGVLSFYYSGFDSDWHDFSPITIIGETVIQRAIHQGMGKVNFFSGTMPWKTRWGAQPDTPNRFLVGFSPHPVSLLYASARRRYRKSHF